MWLVYGVLWAFGGPVGRLASEETVAEVNWVSIEVWLARGFNCGKAADADFADGDIMGLAGGAVRLIMLEMWYGSRTDRGVIGATAGTVWSATDA